MKVGELAQRLDVPYRDVRYVLEQALLPAGVEEKPGRGDHRELDPSQALWLAIVLKLKAIGLKTPIAAEVATFSRRAVTATTQNLNWEYTFDPFKGKLTTKNQWIVEVADLKFIRLVTTANPSKRHLHAEPWHTIQKLQPADEISPIVTVQIDIAGLCRLLT
jgi:hypothetical protein